jgi:hypothetical protein
MRRATLTIAFVLAASVAYGQSPYVAATIGADISRVNRTESSLGTPESSGSEVVSWSLRVGTEIGQNWGAELEFVRSGRSHSSLPGGIAVPLSTNSLSVITAGSITTPGTTSSLLPVRFFESDIRTSHSDFDAIAWARQRVSGSVDLVYLGGIAFSRERLDITQTFPTAGALLPVPRGNFRTTAITYGTRPLVGAEARIGLTSHVRLIPGVRLQGLADGWLLRPYAGLGWFF